MSTKDYDHDQKCSVCGEKMEISMVGNKNVTFYCKKCKKGRLTGLSKVWLKEDKGVEK